MSTILELCADSPAGLRELSRIQVPAEDLNLRGRRAELVCVRGALVDDVVFVLSDNRTHLHLVTLPWRARDPPPPPPPLVPPAQLLMPTRAPFPPAAAAAAMVAANAAAASAMAQGARPGAAYGAALPPVGVPFAAGGPGWFQGAGMWPLLPPRMLPLASQAAVGAAPPAAGVDRQWGSAAAWGPANGNGAPQAVAPSPTPLPPPSPLVPPVVPGYGYVPPQYPQQPPFVVGQYPPQYPPPPFVVGQHPPPPHPPFVVGQHPPALAAQAEHRDLFVLHTRRELLTGLCSVTAARTVLLGVIDCPQSKHSVRQMYSLLSNAK